MWLNVNESPGLEFQQRDNRPTHDLNEVVTLADVKRAKQLKEEADAQNVRIHRATAWLPKKHRGDDASDEQPSTKGVPFVPTAAARQQLSSEKPALLHRMDGTLARCRVLRDNRNYRLNSLGVFDDDKNEVRARSMQRVQVHKDLSTTSMRLPDTHKEVKSERPDSSMEAKLERMCDKVVQSLPEQPAKPSAPHFRTFTSTKHGASMGARASSPGMSMATRQTAGTLGAISEGGTTVEHFPARATSPDQPPMGSVFGHRVPPPSSRKVRTTSNLGYAVGPSESRRDLSRELSVVGNPSKQPTAQSAALQQSASTLPTPTPSTLNVPQPEGSKVHKQDERGSRRHGRLRPRTAGPLKQSPFASSLGAGTGLAPRRPASIFRSSKGIETPIYGRRSNAQARATAANTSSHLLQGRRAAAGGRDWGLSDVALNAELAEAHFANIHAATEDNIARYHRQVGDAQLEFLRENGLQEEVLQMTPEELQATLEQQLMAEQMEEEEESLRQNRSAHGALNPTSIKSLVQSALEHTAMMTEDLDMVKASHSRPSPKSGRRRRKPSIPMAPKAGASTGSLHGSQLEAGKATELSEISESPLEAEGSSSRHIQGADGESLRAWSPGEYPSKRLTIVRRHGHRRRTELMRAAPRSSTASKLGIEDGASTSVEDEEDDDEDEEEEEEEDALVLQVNEDAQQGLNEALLRGTQQPQQHDTFSAARLDAFRARLEEAAEVSVEEFALQLPVLPTLPTMPSVPLHVQARLERVWNLLHLPLTLRLDAVMEYTKHSRLLQFEQALKVWEQAVVAVTQRESVLDTLLLVQKGVEEGSISYLTISAIERQCVQLVQLTACVEQLKQVLRDMYAVELTFHGQPYPGSQQPSINQLLEFMEWLKDSSDSVVCLS